MRICEDPEANGGTLSRPQSQLSTKKNFKKEVRKRSNLKGPRTGRRSKVAGRSAGGGRAVVGPGASTTKFSEQNHNSKKIGNSN